MLALIFPLVLVLAFLTPEPAIVAAMTITLLSTSTAG